MPSLQTGRHGVDVDRLLGTIAAIEHDTSLARCTCRAASEWVGRGRSRTTIQGFYGFVADAAARGIEVATIDLEGAEPRRETGGDA
jgi:hypothetical protein